MIVAFKNRQIAPDDWLNKLIGYWTESPWVHCEILLMTPRQMAISVRPSNNGVAVASWASVLTDPEGWEAYYVPVSDESVILDFLLDQSGKGFNYKGLIAGQVFKANLLQPQRWFCSELTYATILQYGLVNLPIVNPTHVSPALLRQYLIDSNCQLLTIHQLLTN